MHVSVQRDLYTRMPQNLADRLQINIFLHTARGEGMTKLVEATNGYFLVEVENEM